MPKQFPISHGEAGQVLCPALRTDFARFSLTPEIQKLGEGTGVGGGPTAAPLASSSLLPTFNFAGQVLLGLDDLVHICADGALHAGTLKLTCCHSCVVTGFRLVVNHPVHSIRDLWGWGGVVNEEITRESFSVKQGDNYSSILKPAAKKPPNTQGLQLMMDYAREQKLAILAIQNS